MKSASDNERRHTSPRRKFQFEMQIPVSRNGSNGVHPNYIKDALDQPAMSNSVLGDNSSRVMPHMTESATHSDQCSAQSNVLRGSRELDIDERARDVHPIVTPSHFTRASKRRCEETQPLSKDKRSCLAMGTEDGNDDADKWENQDRYSSKDGFKKNEVRVKRTSASTGKAIYDMKFHPMDRTTRPNMATTRRVVAKETEDGEINNGNDGDRQPSSNAANNTEYRRSHRSNRGKYSQNLQYSMTLSTKPLAKNIAFKSTIVTNKTKSITPGTGNLLESLIGVDFDNLCSMDRLLHNIQHGAPLDSISLPHSWTKVSDILVKEGFFTKAQYKAWDGVAALKRRYDALRCVVQGVHVNSETRDTRDQALYWAEGMDVLDHVGSRTIYQHRGVPQYMEGIEKFTQNILDQKKIEFFGSADKAPSTLVLGSESSWNSSIVAGPVALDKQITTGASLEDDSVPMKRMEQVNELDNTHLHSENSPVVVEEHNDKEAAIDICSRVTESLESPLAHDDLSLAPKIIASREHNELEAPPVTTSSALFHSPQTPTMKGKTKRRSKRSKWSSWIFTIHEDSSDSTPTTTQNHPGGILDPEDSKENTTVEDDNVEAAEDDEIDGISDSSIAASGQNSSGRRRMTTSRSEEIEGALHRPVSNLDPDLPLNELSRIETSQKGVQSTRSSRTSSTLTSMTEI
ncbi:hypothetical protein MMC26_000009 [Xylographa opegraphella]|nr:hypothetical protein [Xylographa opegraphella]